VKVCKVKHKEVSVDEGGWKRGKEGKSPKVV